MKCLHCRINEDARLTGNESPDGKPFTLGLCKECLRKALIKVLNIADKK